jgi:hypothetical protein
MNWYFNMQANTGSLFLSKFLYSQAIIDIALQVIYNCTEKQDFLLLFNICGRSTLKAAHMWTLYDQSS